MRDIDVLVPGEQALAAFDALASAGFGRRQGDLTPIEHALAHAKHLPALVCPQSGVTVEIHTRLMVDVPNGAPRETIADSQALFERLIRQSHAGHELPYLSPTDTLLHLIVHAAYDHRFNIGPTVINDVAATLSSAAIDWDLFWTMARAGEWERGCKLLLALAEHYHRHTGTAELRTDDPPICDATMADAALLMLMDTGAFTSTQVRTALSGIGDLRKNLGFLFGKALPPRHVLSSFARLPADSIKAWAYYPAWLAAQTRQSFFGKTEAATKADSRRLAQIEKWVTAEP